MDIGKRNRKGGMVGVTNRRRLKLEGNDADWLSPLFHLSDSVLFGCMGSPAV